MLPLTGLASVGTDAVTSNRSPCLYCFILPLLCVSSLQRYRLHTLYGECTSPAMQRRGISVNKPKRRAVPYVNHKQDCPCPACRRRRGLVKSRLTTSVPVDVHEWLRSQPGGVSATIERLV